MAGFVSTATVLTFLVRCITSVGGESCSHKIDTTSGIHGGKRLLNHGVMNETARHPFQCFTKCVQNCLCESFNVCGERCELSSSTRTKSNDDFKNEVSCTYYDILRIKGPQAGGCEKSSQICCAHNNPCLNGGECVGLCTDQGKRFECRCKIGSYGDRCQASQPASCQDYLIIPKPSNGIYEVIDQSGNRYKVFCDFDSEEGIAWTLIASHTRDVVFINFLSDFSAKNIDHPGSNWGDYHLSKSTMSYVSGTSTHWRSTCEFNTLGVDYVDYIRSKISVTNLMTYRSSRFKASNRCRMIEYVNIRGKSCSDCTVGLHQGGHGLHMPHYVGAQYGCEFVTTEFAAGCASGTNEYYFGLLYEGNRCITGQYRCAASTGATTQFWFGGKS